MSKRTLFFTMVMHPVSGWTRAGNAYATRDSAKEWARFVRKAWRGLRVRVSQCTIHIEDGRICDKSRRVLSDKFNLDTD